MKKLFLLLVMLIISPLVLANDDELSAYCKKNFDSNKIGKIEENIGVKLSFTEFIDKVFQADMGRRNEVIEFQLPGGHSIEEELDRLNELNKNYILRDAVCLGRKYQDGDELYSFTIDDLNSYEAGVALFRNGSVIYYIVLERLIV